MTSNRPVEQQDGGFFYVEWQGKPCPFCGVAGVSGKSPSGHFFAGCPDADCLAHNLAYDFVTVDHARAAWDTRASSQAPSDDVVELVKQLREGKWWQTVVRGPNPTSFSFDMTPIARRAADDLEALTTRASDQAPSNDVVAALQPPDISEEANRLRDAMAASVGQVHIVGSQAPSDARDNCVLGDDCPNRAIPPAGGVEALREALRAAQTHLHAMQHQACQYVEPTGYTSFDRKQIAFEYDQEAKDSLFTSDMIYLLDGPEQRELEAKIDAVLESTRK